MGPAGLIQPQQQRGEAAQRVLGVAGGDTESAW